MAEVPSLVTLCVNTLKTLLLYGAAHDDGDGDGDGDGDDVILQGVYELPVELFDCLMRQLPALALLKLQSHMPSGIESDFDLEYDYSGTGRKRVRFGKFDAAWKLLFQSRWPELSKHLLSDPFASRNALEGETINDWRQKYWETHLQNCFDAAAERAMLPSFDGCPGETIMPSTLIKAIGFQIKCSGHVYSKLRGHCQEFGSYVRFLRLQNVLCNAETCHLLINSKLQGLLVRRISSKMHIDGLCKILSHNRETISSLQFVNCNISLAFLDAICDSLSLGSALMHRLKHFTVRASKLLESNLASLPPKLVSFLSSGSLESISFCEGQIGRNYAKLTLMTLLDASSTLSALELSDNNISGWLSGFRCKSVDQQVTKSLPSLRVLNLRGNNLQKNDMEDLTYALIHMPVLETLDLADNPIGDDGIKSLIRYFGKTIQQVPLANLSLKNCNLSYSGAMELLEVLLALEYPLTSLSLADNDLGSQIAQPLGDFLRSSVKSLDIRDIGLGSSGFLELRISVPDIVNVISINISENRGGIQAAEFVGELIQKAPGLIGVHAGYNLMPPESLNIICEALRTTGKGKIEQIDLMGNPKLCLLDHTSMIAEFLQQNGKPIVVIPTSASQDAPYDDEP